MAQYLVIVVLVVACGYTLIRSTVRSARDVMEDLLEQSDPESDGEFSRRAGSRNISGMVGRNRFGRSDLFGAKQRKRQMLRTKLLPWLSALILVLLAVMVARLSLANLIVVAIFGLAGGYLFGRWLAAKAEADLYKKMEFYLPIVMERVVMAVQAGLDIMPAIRTIVELEDRCTSIDREMEGTPDSLDPVSALLRLVYQLTEAGLGFEQSLREVSGIVNCSALRHAFVHLAVAQKEGGELVMPLKELSDATQLYYQESIEEDIAKLPVKATMPLVCTFAGLIICFITAPLLQVISLTSQAVIK